MLFDELAHFAVDTLCDPAFWSPSNTGARQLAQDLAKVTNRALDASANCFSALLDEEEDKLSLFGAVMQATIWKDGAVPPPRNGLPVDLNVNHRRMFWVLAGIMLVAPRVDHNVILGRGHLIKCPFSLHSATHLVSVPVDIHTSAQPLMENPESCIFKLGDFFSGNDAISRDTRLRFAQTIALFEERVAHEMVAQASS